MTVDSKLSEFIEYFYGFLPGFKDLNCFLRGLNFHSFFLDNLPPTDLRISFCGSFDQLKRAAEAYDVRLMGELSTISESIFLYEISSSEACVQIEHFRSIDSLESYLSQRPFGFQHSLYSLRLDEEVGIQSSDNSFSLDFIGVIENESEDLMDLLRVCLSKQKVPSQILGSEAMPQISADSQALDLLVNEWITDYRVGSVIDDLYYFNCLPSVCNDFISNSLSGIRWFEQNQKIIEQIFSQCFPSKQLKICKAMFFLCISSQADIDVLNDNDKKAFISIVNETQDWWLESLQGQNLNTGLVESWILKFRNQYKLATFCSCLLTVNKFRESDWFNFELCLSRIVEVISKMSNEENHVMSELSSYLNDSVDSDFQITALIESWGGRLRTRKQWQSFLGLN